MISDLAKIKVPVLDQAKQMMVIEQYAILKNSEKELKAQMAKVEKQLGTIYLDFVNKD